ncbi:MAG: 5-formyltetrahydrofolate cyclo-ligase [Actinomycetes bacterium]
MPTDVDTHKTALRARMLGTRVMRAVPDREAAAVAVRASVLALPEIAHARVVAGYSSTASEVGTDRLLEDLHEAGVRVLLPVVLSDLDLDWSEYTGRGSLGPEKRGVREPLGRRLGPDAVATADVVLVPALAADRAGHRLGRGGGSYDRALARVASDRLVAALLYDEELVDEIPAASHDRAVTAVVTPSGVHRVPGPGVRGARSRPSRPARPGSSGRNQG